MMILGKVYIFIYIYILLKMHFIFHNTHISKGGPIPTFIKQDRKVHINSPLIQCPLIH